MKIISKYEDYYDSAQAFGSEPLTYVRKPLENWLPNHDLGEDVRIISGSIIPERVEYAERITLFCGKCIPSIEIVLRDERGNVSHYSYFDFSSADKAISEMIAEDRKAKSSYESGDLRGTPYWRRRNFGISRARVKGFFDQPLPVNSDKIHHEHQAPVVSYGKSSIFTYCIENLNHHRSQRLAKPEEICFLPHNRPERHPIVRCINPILSVYGFQRRFNPYQAHQEISMYLGGVLCNAENNLVKIDDKSMRDAKGFNDMSFKKRASKRRR